MASPKVTTRKERPSRTTTECVLFSKYENGQKRTLKFDVNALADFEEKTGMGFSQMMSQRALFGSARAMFWAGLKHEDRGLAIEDVGDLLSDYLADEDVAVGVNNIDEALMIAIAAAVEQGALGRRDLPKKIEDGKTVDAEAPADPNPPADAATSSIPTMS